MIDKALLQRVKDYKLWLFLVIIVICITTIIPVMFKAIWTKYTLIAGANTNETKLIIKTVFTNYVIAPIIFIFVTIVILMEIRSSFAKNRFYYLERCELAQWSKRCKNMISVFLTEQILILLNIILLITSILAIDTGFINSQAKNEFVRIVFILMGFMIIYELFIYPILFATYFIVTKKVVFTVVISLSIILLSFSLISTNIWNRKPTIDDVKLNLYDSNGNKTLSKISSQQLNLISFYENNDFFVNYFEDTTIRLESDKHLQLAGLNDFLIHFCESGKTMALQTKQQYYVCYQERARVIEEINKPIDKGLNQITEQLMISPYLTAGLSEKIASLKKYDIQTLKAYWRNLLGQDGYDETYDEEIKQNLIENIKIDQKGISIPFKLHIPNEALKVLLRNMFYADLINSYENPLTDHFTGDNTNLESFYQYLDSTEPTQRKMYYQWFNQFQWLDLNQIKGDLHSLLHDVNYSSVNMEEFINNYITPANLIEQLKLSEIPQKEVERYYEQQDKSRLNKIFNLSTHFTDFFAQLIYTQVEVEQMIGKLSNLEEKRYFQLIPAYQMQFERFHNGYIPSANPTLLINAGYYLIGYFIITLIALGFVINRYNKYLLLQTSSTSLDYLLEEITLLTNKKNKRNKKWRK